MLPDASSYDVSCMFQGVQGNAVMTDSSTASCTFDAGVPAGNAAIATLIFKDQASSLELTTDANGITLTNTLTIGAGSSGLTCSFAGGCTYSVAGNGIAGAL